MRLKKTVLKAINIPRHRLAIAMSMNCTEWAINKYIQRNDVKMTQYAPLQVIKKIMGVGDVEELLEEDEIIETAKS